MAVKQCLHSNVFGKVPDLLENYLSEGEACLCVYVCV